jgi:hypothetical protein
MFFTTSWDDGNKMDLKIAKLLKRLDLKGTFYIPIIRNRNCLSNLDIKKISKDFEIGSHGFSHKRLIFLRSKEMQFEVSKSKMILERISGKKIIAFAYPFGSYNKKTSTEVKNAGYKFARTVVEGNFSKPKNPFAAGISLNFTNLYVSPLRILARLPKFNSFNFYDCFRNIVENATKNDIVHIVGHSWEFSSNERFEKLTSLLEYVSKQQVKPIINSEILKISHIS